MRRRRRARLRLLALAAGALAAYVAWAIWVPVGKGEAKVIVISPGESTRMVAAMLKQEGLIRNETAFLALAWVTRRYRCMQSGGHRLAPSMSTAEILDAVCRGTRRAWRWLAIPEGYTLRQVAAAVDEAALATKEEFLRAARARYDPGFPLPKLGLEGYLLPETYRIDYGAQARQIVSQMLQQFRETVWEDLLHEQPSHQGRSLPDIITLASLVEAEAKLDRERPVIAGVLMNRLRLGQKLECDATVQYALGADRKQRLLYKDLEVESEYNTYLHEGLPPGPICNPGVASIKAAMEPASVLYLYYVARADGSHSFSRTFAEHTAAIARIRQGAGQ